MLVKIRSFIGSYIFDKDRPCIYPSRLGKTISHFISPWLEVPIYCEHRKSRGYKNIWPYDSRNLDYVEKPFVKLRQNQSLLVGDKEVESFMPNRHSRSVDL